MKKAYSVYTMLTVMALPLLMINGSLAAAAAESLAPSCPTGETLCAGECTNTKIDELNCGLCGNVCPLGKACINGTCSCLPGQPVCNGTCVDISIDPANCGSCGRVCPGKLYCINGECSCPEGAIPCNGSCTYIGLDDQNCGGCGKICPSDMTCINGSCVSSDVLVLYPNSEAVQPSG
jgi:hypothetical protein